MSSSIEVPQMFPLDTIAPKINSHSIIVESYPWMCIDYHYNHWEYRKEQLISNWNPNFKVVWK